MTERELEQALIGKLKDFKYTNIELKTLGISPRRAIQGCRCLLTDRRGQQGCPAAPGRPASEEQ